MSSIETLGRELRGLIPGPTAEALTKVQLPAVEPSDLRQQLARLRAHVPPAYLPFATFDGFPLAIHLFPGREMANSPVVYIGSGSQASQVRLWTVRGFAARRLAVGGGLSKSGIFRHFDRRSKSWSEPSPRLGPSRPPCGTCWKALRRVNRLGGGTGPKRPRLEHGSQPMSSIRSSSLATLITPTRPRLSMNFKRSSRARPILRR